MKVFNLLLLLLISTNVFAEFSSKRKSEITVSIGCVAGLATGLYMDSNDKNEDKSSVGTLGLNTALGCILGLGYSAIFGSDDQKHIVQKNDALSNQVEKLERVIRNSTSKPTDKAKYLDYLEMEQNFKGEEALYRLVDNKCVLHRFYLGFDGRKAENLYIPVSNDVIITNIEYYIVRPKDLNDKDLTCVKPLQPFGYLNLELRGLDDILYNHAKGTMMKMNGSK